MQPKPSPLKPVVNIIAKKARELPVHAAAAIADKESVDEPVLGIRVPTTLTANSAIRSASHLRFLAHQLIPEPCGNSTECTFCRELAGWRHFTEV
jgi:hypothetical protein